MYLIIVCITAFVILFVAVLLFHTSMYPESTIFEAKKKLQLKLVTFYSHDQTEKYIVDRENRQFISVLSPNKTIPYELLTINQAEEITNQLGDWEWYNR